MTMKFCCSILLSANQDGQHLVPTKKWKEGRQYILGRRSEDPGNMQTSFPKRHLITINLTILFIQKVFSQKACVDHLLPRQSTSTILNLEFPDGEEEGLSKGGSNQNDQLLWKASYS